MSLERGHLRQRGNLPVAGRPHRAWREQPRPQSKACRAPSSPRRDRRDPPWAFLSATARQRPGCP